VLSPKNNINLPCYQFEILEYKQQLQGMCVLIVHFHYLMRTKHVLAEVRLKKTSPEGEAIKGLEIQPLKIQAWKHDQRQVSCSCS